MYCLNIWSAVDSKTHNLWLDPINNAKLVIHSRHNSPHHGEQHLTSDSDQSLPMPTIDPHDLVGHTFYYHSRRMVNASEHASSRP
jgi:hypothetical protein